MPLSSKIIISDTSCLILLIKIGELDLLRKFSERVFITSIIKNELKIDLPLWIEVAAKLNLKFSGTFGFLLKLKETGILETLKPIIEKIRQTNFRFSEQLLSDVLKMANEN